MASVTGEPRDAVNTVDLDYHELYEYDQRPETEKLAELKGLGRPLRAGARGPLPAHGAEGLEPDEAGFSAPTVFADPSPSRAIARTDPQSSLPPDPTGALHKLAEEARQAVERQQKKARKDLAAALQRIEAQEGKCVEPVIADHLQQIELQRRKVLLASGSELAARLKEEQALARDLEAFKAQNGVTREPHYPASHVFSAGVLLVLVLVEAGLNGVLFAGGSEAGLVGGWTEAIVLAVANVGVAFLLGFVGLRALNARGVLLKAGAALGCAVAVVAIVAINLFGAHYRDFKTGQDMAAAPPPGVSAAPPVLLLPGDIAKAAASGKPGKAAPPAQTAATAPAPGAAATATEAPPPVAPADRLSPERAAIEKAITAPWDVASFNGIFLFVIGLCAAALAAIDGYRMDDPLPGYGRRHRRFMEARARSEAAMEAALAKAMAASKGGFEAAERAVQAFAREVQELKARHDEYAALCRSWDARLDEHEREAVRGLQQHCRLHKLPAPAGPPPGWRCDPLPEVHAKALRAREKAAKALRQSISAEREKLLSLFGGAPEQFSALAETYSRQRLSA